jgi:polysaccharide export outer membrane protein
LSEEVPATEGIAKPAPTVAPRAEEFLDTYTFNPGDRVKIAVYGRDDLPTEYRVSVQGQIAVPTIGTFDVMTSTPQQFEVMLLAELQRAAKYSGVVAVESMEPIFVTGLVSKPGAYPYAPGMIAIQAATLAGGTLVTASPSWLPTEAIREASRQRASELELIGLLAKQARLFAERNGEIEISVPSTLVELAGASRAAVLIEQERRILQQGHLSIERQRQSFEVSIKEARTEIAAYEDEIANIKQQRRLRVTMLKPLKSLADRGLTTQQRLTDSQLLLVSIERDAQSAIANLSRARQGLERSERDLAMLALDRSSRIDKELRDADEQIAKAKAAREGAAKLVSYVAALPSEMLQSNNEFAISFEIMRKSKDGRFTSMIADEMTPLMPGDVLRARASHSE